MAQELQISLRLCTLPAEAYQGIVGDPVWQETLVPHSLEDL